MRRWLADNLEPLLEDEIMDFQHWIEEAPYPSYRKEQLRVANDTLESEGLKKRDLENKSFTKWETYEAFKHCRSINSRSDKFKCYSGPLFHSVEKKVFSNAHFMKFVPVKDRPATLVERLEGWKKFYVSDFTSFESSMVEPTMLAVECQLYSYMLSKRPEAAAVIIDALTGENVCRFDGYTVKVGATRMSGDMCTSLGNGFTNLMVNLFVAEESGARIDGLVEGDDGVFGVSGDIKEELFRQLGFIIKLDWKENLYNTSFCGMSFTREMTSMGDPRKILLNFGWTHSRLGLASDKYLPGLLRSKALSLVYEHPRCPILTALGLRVLQLTRSVKRVSSDDSYKRKIEEESVRFSAATGIEVDKGISQGIREDFYMTYGISPDDQVEVERYLAGWGLEPLSHPKLLSWYAPGSPCRRYWESYVSYFGPEFDFALADEIRPRCYTAGSVERGWQCSIVEGELPSGML